jgi:hypothetical protein
MDNWYVIDLKKDNRIELPIRMKRNGPGSEAPITIIDMIERSKNQYG